MDGGYLAECGKHVTDNLGELSNLAGKEKPNIMSAERPPLSQIIIYAMGQLGWSLASFGAASLLVYFYLPPEASTGALFPTFISQGAILGIALIGLINFSGRLFDAITDPIVGNWSDRSTSKFGKRKKFMAIAAVPFALFSFLIFFPPDNGESTLNGIWLTVSIFLFYLFMTLYVIPYTALIGEMGHHPDDRMRISTIASVTWALGFMIGSNAYALQAYFQQQQSATSAFQTTIGIFALISLVFMLVPVFFLKESRYCQQSKVETNAFHAVRAVFKNRNFIPFAIADLMYWLALTFIQSGVGYYVTILMGFPKEQATLFLTISFLTSLLLYWPVNVIVRRVGKKKTVIAAFLVFSFIFGLTTISGLLPVSKDVLFYVLSLSSGFPLAVFGIVPMAIIADILYQHEADTGEQHAGMFYAARNLTMKMGISLANLIFPSLLLLGKSVQNPLGVQLSTLLAMVFCLAGCLVFMRYRDIRNVS